MLLTSLLSELHARVTNVTVAVSTLGELHDRAFDMTLPVSILDGAADYGCYTRFTHVRWADGDPSLEAGTEGLPAIQPFESATPVSNDDQGESHHRGSSLLLSRRGCREQSHSPDLHPFGGGDSHIPAVQCVDPDFTALSALAIPTAASLAEPTPVVDEF